MSHSKENKLLPAKRVWKLYFSSDKASQPEQRFYLSFTAFQLLQSPYLAFEWQGTQAWCFLKYFLRVHCSLVWSDLGIWFVVSFPLHPHSVGQFQPIITSPFIVVRMKNQDYELSGPKETPFPQIIDNRKKPELFRKLWTQLPSTKRSHFPYHWRKQLGATCGGYLDTKVHAVPHSSSVSQVPVIHSKYMLASYILHILLIALFFGLCLLFCPHSFCPNSCSSPSSPISLICSYFSHG